MIQVIVTDGNIQSKDFITNSLNALENVEVIGSFEKLPDDNELYSKTNLIVFDINSNNSFDVINKIKELKANFKNINFIASSFEINPKIVNEVLALGVIDFHLKPIIPTVLEASIKKMEQIEPKTAKTICLFSNKGGIGKTSILTNLAWEIYQKTNEKVCILDFSFNAQDASTYLNTKQNATIEEILSNIEELDENILLNQLGKYKDSKIYLLEAQEDLISQYKITTQQISKIINALKNIFDYVLIDTSSAINENNAIIFDNSDLILLISSTNTTSIKNSQKCYELFDKIGYNDDKIKLIINRYIESEEINIKTIEEQFNRKIFQTIPNNYLTLIDAINLESNVGEVNPHSNIAKAYSRIADEILKIEFEVLKENSKQSHGIFNLLQKMGEE